MIVLALDTTTPRGSLAVWAAGALVAVAPTDPRRPFSDQLPAAANDLLRAQGLSAADVDVFAVASGPGSLTGLRVGIATAQGLALALGRPAVGVSALEALSLAAAFEVPRLAVGECAGAWTDAHRGEVFAALYELVPDEPDGQTLRLLDGPSVGVPADVVARWMPVARGRSIRLAGSAAQANAALISHQLGPAAMTISGPLLAGIVAEVAARRAARGDVSPPHALQPLYVRRPDAELARDRARAREHEGGTP